MIQSAYSCAILYVKHKKLPFFASSATTLILLCQRLSTNGKVVLKYCNISKTLEKGSITPPPPRRPFVAPRGQVNVSYFNYFSLFTCPSLCRQDHFTVYIWYCIQAVSTDPGTYNWGPVYKYPFLFEIGVFFPSGFAYRLHVASEVSHGKRVFSKPLFRVEIFEKMLDTIASQCAFSHQRITIFSYISFSFGHLETIEKTQRVDGDFLNTEEKKSPFSN